MSTFGTGGCQPKDRETPFTATTTRPAGAGGSGGAGAAYPPSREPLRRVEEISQPTSKLAESLVGRKCRVQLRRDALGMAGNMPTQLSGRWANESSVDGTVIELTDQWLVVQASDRRVVIPHASILLVELHN